MDGITDQNQSLSHPLLAACTWCIPARQLAAAGKRLVAKHRADT